MKDTRGACPVEQPSRAHMGSQNLSCSHRAIMHLHQVLCLHVMTVSLVFCVRLLIVRGHVSLIFIFALESLFFFLLSFLILPWDEEFCLVLLYFCVLFWSWMCERGEGIAQLLGCCSLEVCFFLKRKPSRSGFRMRRVGRNRWRGNSGQNTLNERMIYFQKKF